ncbi:hypothetical protein M9H77_11139 [Catharanthus roseus]|uniref:Uncharacterized protein n=1 Tax=Catharanthus roseus TaxID=4058 RepID=A0ACC0BDM7_CATRO|nr:hypothetical protein M9H77_11139 [Catharanthus roseus]
MFAPPVRAGARLCKPCIQRFATLGHKTKNKLIDLHIRLDTMTTDEEHRRPANNRVCMVKNVFIEALWREAPSHLLTSTWTSILAIPLSQCTDDYMPWFLPRTHPRIQNPDRLSRGVQLSTTTPITPHVLLDMVAHELDCDDIDDATKVSRAFDMIKSYHQTRH